MICDQNVCMERARTQTRPCVIWLSNTAPEYDWQKGKEPEKGKMATAALPCITVSVQRRAKPCTAESAKEQLWFHLNWHRVSGVYLLNSCAAEEQFITVVEAWAQRMMLMSWKRMDDMKKIARKKRKRGLKIKNSGKIFDPYHSFLPCNKREFWSIFHYVFLTILP